MVDTGPHLSRHLRQRPERQRKAAEAYLEEVAGRSFRGLPVRAVLRTCAHVAQGILEQAEVLGVDLIVMATHGRGGLERFGRGSVADKVLRGAAVPVLVHRPERLARAREERQREQVAAR